MEKCPPDPSEGGASPKGENKDGAGVGSAVLSLTRDRSRPRRPGFRREGKGGGAFSISANPLPRLLSRWGRGRGWLGKANTVCQPLGRGGGAMKIRVEEFRYDEFNGNVPALEPVIEIVERCTCFEEHGWVLHNDGGVYHTRIVIYKIAPGTFLAVVGDTREVFSVDEYKYMVVWVGDELVGAARAKEYDYYLLLGQEELENELDRYEQEGYNIYYYAER